MKNEIVFFDVDGVVADLHTPWLERYNKDWKDVLSHDDIRDWHIAKFVRPECGVKGILKYIQDPSIYDDVPPIGGALDGIKRIRNLGFDIVFATSIDSAKVAGRKFFWLNDWGFEVDLKHYIEIGQKNLLRGGILVDDAPHNLEFFSGYKILFGQPWNESNPLSMLRVRNWNELVGIFAYLM